MEIRIAENHGQEGVRGVVGDVESSVQLPNERTRAESPAAPAPDQLHRVPDSPGACPTAGGQAADDGVVAARAGGGVRTALVMNLAAVVRAAVCRRLAPDALLHTARLVDLRRRAPARATVVPTDLERRVYVLFCERSRDFDRSHAGDQGQEGEQSNSPELHCDCVFGFFGSDDGRENQPGSEEGWQGGR